eukprot:CAMPEP_0119551320 /NCGR_PEP_ID=MMETSP1352-20130426/4603_1 /TAXON_ID=265584 /ORGANISM="Stauroneis constricta, Strain CCMP1120" /LENGTH=477 /DNA_ID=CAMNT_0007597353 /DNA_START=167 /DNA_END=1600 /DNA_ORIENTATION=+
MKIQFRPNVLNAAMLVHLVSKVTAKEMDDIVNRFHKIHGEPIDFRMVRHLALKEEANDEDVAFADDGIETRRRAKKDKSASSKASKKDGVNIKSVMPAELFKIVTEGINLSREAALEAVYSVNDLSKSSTVNQIGKLLDDEDLCFTGTASDVSAACGDECCTGPDACEWEGDATVCIGSCKGEQSCYQIEEGTKVAPLSCVGRFACTFVGRKNADLAGQIATDVVIGPKSCRGRESCSSMGFRYAKSINIGYASCLGYEACYYLGSYAKGEIFVGKYACDSQFSKYACHYADADEDITIRDTSCVGEKACYFLGQRRPGTVDVGSDSCFGYKACYELGGNVIDGNIDIENGACVGKGACERLGKNTESATIFIGTQACNGNQVCKSIGASYDNGPSLISIGDKACSSGPDYACFAFGYSVYDGGEVKVAANACSDEDDVCTKYGPNGDAACDANACNNGESFKMPAVEEPCAEICVA